ncbi:hypothetical protein [Lysinibacillus endophyticus]|uniref:hypothetical protein n=1 Tax=Ureibacillus endophyticus TaxID=1978490 RepID=UPI0020A19295|nr:hypothetical protein [Lysinibacillus endophyticus]MCP1143679.1 hypothetical protein [Lysinibacillus endophyticus]
MKRKLLFISFLAVLLVTGCSNDENQTKEEENNEQDIVQNETNKEKKSLEENKKITKNLQQEKGVISGQVIEENDKVSALIEIEEKVNEKEANTLAEKYVRELKKVFKNQDIIVKVEKEGKVIAKISDSDNEAKDKNIEEKESKSKTTPSNNITLKSLSEKGGLTLNSNPITQQISVVIDSSALSKELANKKATDIILEVEGKEYPFTVNPFKETLFEVQNTDFTEKQLLAAIIKIK